MKRIILITIISFLLLKYTFFLIYPLIVYFSWQADTVRIICMLSSSIIILNYFNELYRINISYTKVIVIAFAIPVIFYSIHYGFDYYYYKYTDEGIKALNAMPPSGYIAPPNGGLGSVEPFRSPIDYSILDALIQDNIREIIYFYQTEQRFLILLQIISFPIILLIFFSRYQMFKKLNLKPLYSLFYPFRYFSLIKKFELPRIWKFYLFVPFLNIIFRYRINIKVTKSFNLPDSVAIGLMFLPFIFYPKIAFENKDYQESILDENLSTANAM